MASRLFSRHRVDFLLRLLPLFPGERVLLFVIIPNLRTRKYLSLAMMTISSCSIFLVLLAFNAAAQTIQDETAGRLQEWRLNMVNYGRAHCAALYPRGDLDRQLAATYYDAQRVYSYIAEYTGDPSWVHCAAEAARIYRDRYVIPNRGRVPGYWNFTDGLTFDALRYKRTRSRRAAILLARNAAYARDGTPLGATVRSAYSREVAYAIMSYLNTEDLGLPRRARLSSLIDQALGHIDQWFVSKTARDVKPFMVGLTAEALIRYYERSADPAVKPALAAAAAWLWENAWLPENMAFMYQAWPGSKSGHEPAPDLNLLVFPLYSWLYVRTGLKGYQEQARQVFIGGVKGAYLGGPKQFDQNYWLSFRYIDSLLAEGVP